jgi:2-polyprenyl-6-methoxyphenol hydroxylase-like FAD-dependent oxidoreductase
MNGQVGEHAVVIGGSMAGLLAARGLADHYRRVTILERDPLPEGVEPRKGVPQGCHTHGLLASGLQVLEQFFAAIKDELVARGSLVGDVVRDSLWHVQGDFHVRPASGLIGTTQSRPLLESVVRGRVAALPNVTVRDQVSVERLLPDSFKSRILGLQITDRRENCGESLAADLVVDASGRASRSPQWLADLGYAPPREERIEVQIAYATQLFRRKPGDFDDVMAVVLTQLPPSKRFGVALGIEGDQWSVTLGGMFDDVPPKDDAGFRDFAAGLPSPLIHQFLQTAEPVSEIQLYKYPASLRRRYEHLRRFPEGLLVLGDALCSFNPIYGQGMSTAALESVLLSQCLAQGEAGLARRFFRGAARIVDVPWQTAATADFQYPQVRGQRPLLAGAINGYQALVHRAAHSDPVVALAFHRVANLLDQPASLFRPSILARVLAHWWQSEDSAADYRLLETPTQPPRLISGGVRLGAMRVS